MAKRTYAARDCEKCQTPFTPSGPRATRCDDCRGQKAESNGVHENGAATFDALDIIDAFDLDFNTGNAIRFLLEKSDGDELTNLQNARVYIERAISKLEARQAA